MTRDEVYELLLVERYGPSVWWANGPDPVVPDDSEATCARRIRLLAAEFDAVESGNAGTRTRMGGAA